jgi:hypothetical protein
MICKIHPLTPEHITRVSAMIERDIKALLAPPADDQQPGVSSGPTQAERRAELESLFDLARVFAGMTTKADTDAPKKQRKARTPKGEKPQQDAGQQPLREQ